MPASDRSAPAPSAAVSPPAAAALLGAVIVLWGVNWPIMKIGLADIGPFAFGAVRMGAAALILAGIALARGRLRLPDREDWPIVASIGLLQLGVYVGLITWALQSVDAGRSAVLAYTTALWVVPGAALLLGERLSRAKAAGFALGMAGVAAMFQPAAVDWSDRDALVGNAVLLFAAMVWAAQILHARGHRWRAPLLDLAWLQFALGTLVLAAAALVLEGGRPIGWTPSLVAVLLYNGPVATAFCFTAMISVQRALPAVSTSLGTLGVPLVGVLSSALWLGEPVGLPLLAGLALIAGGIALVFLSDRPRGPRPRAAGPKG